MTPFVLLALLAATTLPVRSVSLPCAPEGASSRRVLAIAQELVVKASVERPVQECADRGPEQRVRVRVVVLRAGE